VGNEITVTVTDIDPQDKIMFPLRETFPLILERAISIVVRMARIPGVQ